MSRLKISAISYLNTAPLMWDFEHAEAPAELVTNYDISYTIPSACAEALRAGTADIGIIPAAAYTTVPDLVIIPDVAIATRRAVRSILLVGKRRGDPLSDQTLSEEPASKEPLSKGPLSREPLSKEQWLKQVRTVALDTSSLAKILFAKWLGGARDYAAMAPD